MIIKELPMCYDPFHDPFTTIGPPSCQTVDSEKPASKLIRAVLRRIGIDADTWIDYSIHRCYCNSEEEDEREGALDPSQTVHQLGIREGDSIFIRKRNDRVEEMEKDQDNSTSLSRKRKERDEDEATSQSSLLPPAPTPKSNLENLVPEAAAPARSISKLLGGDGWKSQSIGRLGSVQSRAPKRLYTLLKLVKTSLEVPQLSKSDPDGLFNSDLVEALTRAHHERISTPKKRGDRFFTNRLSSSDYERANELLRGKVDQDGSWERGSLAHLDESVLLKPIHRFPLSDSRLSGRFLNAARAMCVLWNNDKWINQAPLPGLSPISLKSSNLLTILRQIAQLTKVKPGEATPDGFPPIVLKALREAIEDWKSKVEQSIGEPSHWSQKKAIPLALEILKRKLEIKG